MIVINNFPKATKLNPILYDIVCENLSGGVKAGVYGDGGGGIITDYNLHKQNIKEVDELISWVSRILPDASKNFATKGTPRLGLHSHEDEKGYDYDVNSFEIESCWGIHYLAIYCDLDRIGWTEIRIGNMGKYLATDVFDGEHGAV